MQMMCIYWQVTADNHAFGHFLKLGPLWVRMFVHRNAQSQVFLADVLLSTDGTSLFQTETVRLQASEQCQ